jgi:hypothetical protein
LHFVDNNTGRDNMKKDAFKKHVQSVQIEKHETAAWANVRKTKPVSNVAIPSELDVRNAKEWVDTNQK